MCPVQFITWRRCTNRAELLVKPRCSLMLLAAGSRQALPGCGWRFTVHSEVVLLCRFVVWSSLLRWCCDGFPEFGHREAAAAVRLSLCPDVEALPASVGRSLAKETSWLGEASRCGEGTVGEEPATGAAIPAHRARQGGRYGGFVSGVTPLEARGSSCFQFGLVSF